MMADEQEVARTQLADAFRDWVHESELSKCSPSVDTCPDWPLAYELADIALSVIKIVSPNKLEEVEKRNAELQELVDQCSAPEFWTSRTPNSFLLRIANDAQLERTRLKQRVRELES